MTLEQATEILKAHNEWLQNQTTPAISLPVEVTEALTIAIEALTPQPTERPFEYPVPDGWDVKTRGGKEVKYLTELPEVDERGYKFVADIGMGYALFTIIGKYIRNDYSDHENDLILVKKTRTILEPSTAIRTGGVQRKGA